MTKRDDAIRANAASTRGSCSVIPDEENPFRSKESTT
jgi:hypothetical protein